MKKDCNKWRCKVMTLERKDNRKREKELSHKIIQCGKLIMVYHDPMANITFPPWET
jgi:hypothetical protein